MPPLALAPPRRRGLADVTDALSAWRLGDVDELGDEADDLQLLARLRADDDPEAPGS